MKNEAVSPTVYLWIQYDCNVKALVIHNMSSEYENENPRMLERDR